MNPHEPSSHRYRYGCIHRRASAHPCRYVLPTKPHRLTAPAPIALAPAGRDLASIVTHLRPRRDRACIAALSHASLRSRIHRRGSSHPSSRSVASIAAPPHLSSRLRPRRCTVTNTAALTIAPSSSSLHCYQHSCTHHRSSALVAALSPTQLHSPSLLRPRRCTVTNTAALTVAPSSSPLHCVSTAAPTAAPLRHRRVPVPSGTLSAQLYSLSWPRALRHCQQYSCTHRFDLAPTASPSLSLLRSCIYRSALTLAAAIMHLSLRYRSRRCDHTSIAALSLSPLRSCIHRCALALTAAPPRPSALC